ncbi:site-specific DNA-methyltransferase [Coprobacter secundus]|uniref:site-specific DNA-methyltransferase n=1 Tax=Coprobacter secundus TaxID=1501392 RepID=UPI0023F8849F|nr:site-specific DNA-methyltransferase [Coprobacter secundus]
MGPISEVFNINCLEYMKNVPDKYFELAIVDPPYGINAPNMKMGSNRNNISTAERLRKGRLNSGGGKLKDRALQKMPIKWDYKKPSPRYFKELFRVSKNQIIWGGNYFKLSPSRCIVVWDKKQPWDNFSQVELAWTSFDYPAKIVRIGVVGGKNDKLKIHPTQKPIDLYAYLLKTFAKEGDKILDTHLGSGSSRIAAYKLGFDFVGCEIDKEYYAAANERFKNECLGIVQTKNGVLTQQKLF